MFTGIVETQGEVIRSTPSAAGRRLALRATGFWRDVSLGASIAIDGVCLTLAGLAGDVGEFDVVGETLERTTLGALRAGAMVNLEHSLRANSRIDGHFVQGHVEGVGAVRRIEQRPGESKWWFGVPPDVRPYLIPKGSVAVDGVSLTIVDVIDDTFSVVLIPTTLRLTGLASKRPGDRVNLETDVLVRTIVHTLESLNVIPKPGRSTSSERRE